MFTCSCQRCLDPTELGTFGSALICQKCRPKKKGKRKMADDNVGLLMPPEPSTTENTSDGKLKAINWICNSCGLAKSEKEIEEICMNIHREVI